MECDGGKGISNRESATHYCVEVVLAVKEEGWRCKGSVARRSWTVTRQLWRGTEALQCGIHSSPLLPFVFRWFKQFKVAMVNFLNWFGFYEFKLDSSWYWLNFWTKFIRRFIVLQCIWKHNARTAFRIHNHSEYKAHNYFSVKERDN